MAITTVLKRTRQVAAEDSPAFATIAERFRRAGELQRAVHLCEEGLQKYPDHLSARVTLGWALLDLGRHKEARAHLEGALRRAPDNLAAIRGLAQLHDHSSDHEGYAEMESANVWPPVDAEPHREETFEQPIQRTNSVAVDTSAPHGVDDDYGIHDFGDTSAFGLALPADAVNAHPDEPFLAEFVEPEAPVAVESDAVAPAAVQFESTVEPVALVEEPPAVETLAHGVDMAPTAPLVASANPASTGSGVRKAKTSRKRQGLGNDMRTTDAEPIEVVEAVMPPSRRDPSAKRASHKAVSVTALAALERFLQRVERLKPNTSIDVHVQ